MSIIYSTNLIDIVDCPSAFDIGPSYRLLPGDFTLSEPYFRSKLRHDIVTTSTSTEQKSDNTATSNTSVPDSETISTLTRPAKRKRVSNSDIRTQERHDLLQPFLLSCMEHIDAHWPRQQKPRNDEENDKKDQCESLIQFPAWISMATASRRFQAVDRLPVITLTSEYQEFDLLDVFHQLVKNDSSHCRKMILGNHGAYLIPPHCDFYMSELENVEDLSLLLSDGNHSGYDCVVLDPPWPNKSVHRSSHYGTLDIYDLFQIPLPSLLRDNALVAVWITNKPKFRQFVIEKLFKSWQVTCVAEWLWIKVTTHGEPVLPLDSAHRKPYEQLIIGRYQSLTSTSALSKTAEILPTLPRQRSIVSVPSNRHSRKPCLKDVLAPYLPRNPSCLELFARCLTPGWSSWGNECLKFQHESYYLPTTKDEEK